MNYYLLMTIPVPVSPFYIEVGMDYEIPFHPNLTDEIVAANYPCKINEIYYDLDSEYFVIKLLATDNLISTRKNPSPEKIHESLRHEWMELKKWKELNNEKIILNDWLMNTNNEFSEEAYAAYLKAKEEYAQRT